MMSNKQTPTDYIDLSNDKPLFGGGESLVYAYPDNPNFFIKVLSASRQPGGNRKRLPWYKRYRRDGAYMFLKRYMAEYLAYQCRGKGTLGLISVIRGFVDTNLGFGLLVERIHDANGMTSETMAEVLEREGWSGEMESLLETFTQSLIDHHIVFSDFNPRNLLVQVPSSRARRLVAIDGLGDRNLFPLSTLSSRWNANRLMHRKKRIVARWQAASRQSD